jgi:hypothetical protein
MVIFPINLDYYKGALFNVGPLFDRPFNIDQITMKTPNPKCHVGIFDLCRLHTAFLHWPLSSAATKEVQGPDTT